MNKFNDKILVFAGDDKEIEKKKKKANVLTSAFSLMESLVELQEEIEDIKESLDNASIVEQLQKFDAHIDAMYNSLQEITADGVKSIRQRNGLDSHEGAHETEKTLETEPIIENNPSKTSLFTMPVSPKSP